MRSFYKDWSGTSPRPDRTTELVKSSLEHPGGLTKQSCPQDQTGRTIENPGSEEQGSSQDRTQSIPIELRLVGCTPLLLKAIPQIPLRDFDTILRLER